MAETHPNAKVVYIDTDRVGLTKYPMIERIIAMGYPFPITAINGEPRLAGSVHVGEIQAILDGN